MFEKILGELKDFFGEKNEFVHSADLALQERLESPFYGYFALAWLVTNWKLIYTAFFLDQGLISEKVGVLRLEFLLSNFPKGWHILVEFFLIPLAITFFVFWILPFITRPFFRKNIRNKKKLKVIEIQESREEAVQQKELVKEETALIKEEIVKAKEEKKAEEETPEIVWGREFKVFQRSSVFKKFQQILDSVYEHGGKLRDGHITGDYYRFNVETDVLVYADTHGLIDMSNPQNIFLTDKGRFFTQRYLDSFQSF